MPNTEPYIQRNASTADLIAAMPSLTGVPVRNSVVVAPFWGTLTSSALRIDLPHERTKSAYQRQAGALLAHLSRLQGCDRVAVALYTDESYEAALHGWRDMLDHLLERIHSAGFHIAEAAIVAADGWGCFLDEDQPRPLAELEAAEKRAPGRPAPPTLHVLPSTDPDVAAAVDRHVVARLRKHREPDAFGILRPELELDPIEHFEQALNGDPDAAGAATLARIIALMQAEGAVDRTVLQAAFGPDVAKQSWEMTLAYRRRAREVGCEPWHLMKADHLAGNVDGERFARMLSGATSVRPSPERLHRAAKLLGRAVAHCGRQERVWVMCALGWVRWAIGLPSAAEDMLRSASAVDRRNTLVPIYHAIITHCIPEWVFDRDPEPALNRAARRAAARGRR